MRPWYSAIVGQRAITLDPNDPEGFIILAHGLIHDGRPTEAVEAIERAMRLDPHYPSRYLYWLGFAKFHLEEFEEAAPLLEEDVERDADGAAEGCAVVGYIQCLSSIVVLVATYGYLGRDEDARAAIAAWTERHVKGWGVALTLKTSRPYWDHFRHPGYFDRLLNGLRKAGMPEE